MPGEYSLYKGLGDLHDDDENGILTCATPADAGALREHGFDRCAANGGPGQTLAAYLPKTKTSCCKTKLAPTLTLSAASQAAVAANGGGQRQRREECAVFQSPREALVR